MNEPKPARRKPRRAKLENYYKVLGLRANATPAAIKQKYIEKVGLPTRDPPGRVSADPQGV